MYRPRVIRHQPALIQISSTLVVRPTPITRVTMRISISSQTFVMKRSLVVRGSTIHIIPRASTRRCLMLVVCTQPMLQMISRMGKLCRRIPTVSTKARHFVRLPQERLTVRLMLSKHSSCHFQSRVDSELCTVLRRALFDQIHLCTWC